MIHMKISMELSTQFHTYLKDKSYSHSSNIIKNRQHVSYKEDAAGLHIIIYQSHHLLFLLKSKHRDKKLNKISD